MDNVIINIYRAGGAWHAARWIGGEYDGCDELDAASEQEAFKEAMRMPLHVRGTRTVTRVEDL